MKYGCFGKILFVDLLKEQFEERSVPEEFYQQYLGGYGLAVRLLYELTPPKLDPLHPDIPIGLFPGLMTGTPAPFSGRYMVAGKSPLTNTWGDSNSGGTFGPGMKKCGFDGIIIKGAANHPVYLKIIDDSIEILDAGDIWGKDILETDEIIKNKHGRTVKTAGIGQSGENMSRISGIVNDGGRIAARSGLGALMGSKKLKAIVLKGNHKIPYFNRDKFTDLVKEYNKQGKAKEMGKMMKFIMNKIPNMAKMMRKFKVGMAGSPNILRAVYHNYGTAMGNTLSAETGDSPVKNWKGIGMYDFPFSKSKEISINEINKYKISEYGCFSCPVQCGGILNVPELNIKEMHTPEYETCCAFGTLLLNNDLHSLFEINDLCNRAGIDTISLGSTIGFAIECFENGIINQEDTGGLDLNWGNSKEIIKLVKMVIARNGFGDILADGSKIASEKIGKGSEDFSITSLGSEIAMHDPRYTESLAFSYAFDPTPGRHTSASIDFTDVGPIDKFEPRFKLPPKWKKNPDRKAEAQRVCTGFHQILSSSGLCMFSASMGEYPFIDLINSLTGWEMSAEDLITSGIRIQTLRQAFTLREGIDIANNKLPGRVLGIPPDVKGPLKGITVEPEEFYGKYCEKMGWNPNDGYPLEETLKKLDLEFVIKDLY